MKSLYFPFKPPFRYDEAGQRIEEANHQTILDVRGWGFLASETSTHNFSDEEAAAIQDGIGRRVVELMNSDMV